MILDIITNAEDEQYEENLLIIKDAYQCLGKVLSLLGACFDLISNSSLSMNIQIMGGKITENLGFESPLLKVKIVIYQTHENL